MEYNKKVIDHFFNPRNVGEIKNASGVGEVGSPACGDMMYIYIDVKEDHLGKEYIDDIKFKTFGCGAAIATSSVLTEIVKKKTLDELLKLGENDKQRISKLKNSIIESLGELPKIKIHCSVLAADALYDAIKNYEKKKEK